LIEGGREAYSGSSPLVEAVTNSTGIGALFDGSASCSAFALALTFSISAGFSGPKFELLELV
jgi:hypothetical protein